MKSHELTWKPDGKKTPSGRWCKVIEGRTHYFGRAKKKDATKEYDQAVDAYRQFLNDRQERQRQEDRLVELVTRQSQGDPTVQTRMLSDPESILWLWRQSERKRQKQIDKVAMPISDQIELFVEDQKRRQRKGEISESRCNNIERHVNTFNDHVNGASWSTEDDGTNERLLRSYRTFLDEQVATNTIKDSYESDRLEVLKMLVRWVSAERYLKLLPSNLDHICKRKQREANPNPFNVADVRRIWMAANVELRCYMSLALNAGYYAVDISTIQANNLHGDYLIKPRQKTKRHNVIMKHLLWDVTRGLIKKRRVQSVVAGEPILRSPKGGELVKGRKDRCGQALRPVLDQLGIKDKSFSSFRDTGATIISAINPGLREQYLGHKDNSQASFYVADIGVVMGEEKLDSPLDEAIKQLETILDLDGCSLINDK